MTKKEFEEAKKVTPLLEHHINAIEWIEAWLKNSPLDPAFRISIERCYDRSGKAALPKDLMLELNEVLRNIKKFHEDSVKEIEGKLFQ